MQNVTLTPEEKHQLLSVLRDMDRAAPTEQRRHPRRRVQLNLGIRPLGLRGGKWPAILLNVSQQGVALQLEKPLEAGQKFLLPLRFAEGGGWLVLCEVRNCTAMRASYKVGARFMDRVEDPEGNAKPPMDWLL